MQNRQFLWVLAIAIFLVVPAASYAQEATVTGTITDSTGGVLPGVTVTAINTDSGNTFVAVTDGSGQFRMPVRIGPYRITAELQGFATAVRTGLQIQVGQQASISLQLAPSTVQETVTVTGEAPLVDLNSSTAAANVDQRQMSELPLNGRNWLDLTLLAPGSRSTTGGETPIPRGQVAFQINMDGQQMTNSVAGSGFGQTRFSRDSVAEFEFITNRFDATLGRSMGVVVNAVTKSGTNTPSGTFSGYFRDSQWSLPDPVLQRVVPFSNQQYSTAYGGPIKKDRIHVFANYEYEREPRDAVFQSTDFPAFAMDIPGIRTNGTGGVKTDFQFTPKMHLSTRVNAYNQYIPTASGNATSHPSTASQRWLTSTSEWNQFTQVFGLNKVNELKGGIFKYDWDIAGYASYNGTAVCNYQPGCKYPLLKKGDGPPPNTHVPYGASPRISLSGYTIGTAGNLPQAIGQRTYQLRDDFTMSFDARGRHDVKLGGEVLEHNFHFNWVNTGGGALTASVGGTARRPTQAQLLQMFPVWNNYATWSYNALSPISSIYRQSTGNFHLVNDRHALGAWIQDDWKIAKALTLNLGIRWDADLGVMGEKKQILPWQSGHRPHQLDWFQPRAGFAWRLTDRTVVRGGGGVYFTQLENDAAHQSNLNIQTLIPEVNYDGRADFAMNPFAAYGGVLPTIAQAQQQLCSVAATPTCIRRVISSEIPSPSHNDTYSYQSMIGFSHQLSGDLVIEVDYMYTGQRREEVDTNQNLVYSAATGDNLPFTPIANRVYPDWGSVNGEYMIGYSNTHQLVTSVTKRFSRRWQVSGNYNFSGIWDSSGRPCQTVREKNPGDGVTCEPIPFKLLPDVAGEYTLASTDQRGRGVANAIWDVGRGFQVSGLYFYGSGSRSGVSCGSCGTRDISGSNTATRRLPDNSRQAQLTTLLGAPLQQMPDGTWLIPRNRFVGSPIHRVDIRLQQRVGLGGRRSLDGIFEVFNLFDRANYGSFTTNVDSSAFGQPAQNTNIAYSPLSVQLGFRLGF